MEAQAKSPRKQKTKPGKVVRLNPQTWKLVEWERHEGETIDATVRRLLCIPPKDAKSYFFLPKSRVICETKAEARGLATIMHVRNGKKTKLEEPIQLIELTKESK